MEQEEGEREERRKEKVSKQILLLFSKQILDG
jgi:hypothetical protein